MSSIDNFLLSYLEKKYDVKEGTQLYKTAYNLLQALWKGSVCISCSENGFNDSKAVGRKRENQDRPLIYYNGNLYIQKYFIYQEKIIDRIKSLQENKKIHIITGGPGTGKTTSLAEILKNRLNEKIILAAPTGKAALRMKESLAGQKIDLEAKTIHRLLGYKHLSVSFKHTKENLLEADIIAIDECSMIDLPMMSKLLDAIPSNCDLYLLGDKNQLASVEVGSVFADICRMFKDDENIYRELTKNWRAKNAPDIAALSKQILENSIENFNSENVHYFENGKLESELLGKYKNLFSAANEREALDFLKAFQILCVTKIGKNGAEHINKKLYDIAKKEKAKFTPIIITENNYQQNLFNGDVGIKDKEQAYFYISKDEIKAFPILTLPKHEMAFAITIHKAQGSEYECVAVVYPDKEKEDEETTILTKELLYTAITRAKKECFIFGNKEVLVNSCKKSIARASGI